jgi:hypothetical protein
LSVVRLHGVALDIGVAPFGNKPSIFISEQRHAAVVLVVLVVGEQATVLFSDAMIFFVSPTFQFDSTRLDTPGLFGVDTTYESINQH